MDENTMLQETVLRINGPNNLANPIIVCNAEHRFLVAEQCQQINISNPTILLEPVGRNTAPAIAAAALQALKITDNGVLLVLSADHVIEDINAFHQAIDSALKQANDNKLVTFGIVPTDANTGYGYIKSLKNGQVEAFVEKPDLQTAIGFARLSSPFKRKIVSCNIVLSATSGKYCLGYCFRDNGQRRVP
jgi:mannose-1-phosphate guanylyltransferase